MQMAVISKESAQARADQIGSFRRELALLEEEKVIALEREQREAIQAYHEGLLQQFFRTYDVDTNKHEKQLSLGMKISSFLGALGLAASVFFLFYRFWGDFTTPLQIVILVSVPLLLLAATMYVSGKEKTGYFAKILSMVAFAAFVLNVVMLGEIFNITPSENAIFIWALFAFLLAYATDTRLILGMAIIMFSFFLSAKTGTWSGSYWIGFGERPENFFPAALLLFMVPILPHKNYDGFGVIYRVFAMLLFFLPVLVLSNWGALSYLHMIPIDTVEVIYQVVGFAVSLAAILLGIKKEWGEVMTTGNIFFTIFLYTKFFDWWWDALPKYLFFLIIGITAIAMLLLFKRLRHAVTREGAGE